MEEKEKLVDDWEEGEDETIIGADIITGTDISRIITQRTKGKPSREPRWQKDLRSLAKRHRDDKFRPTIPKTPSLVKAQVPTKSREETGVSLVYSMLNLSSDQFRQRISSVLLGNYDASFKINGSRGPYTYRLTVAKVESDAPSFDFLIDVHEGGQMVRHYSFNKYFRASITPYLKDMMLDNLSNDILNELKDLITEFE